MSADFDSSTGAAAVSALSMEAWGEAVLKEYIRTILETFSSSRMSAAPYSATLRIPTPLSIASSQITTPTYQGKLDALQVSVDGQPLVFVPTGDTLSQNQLKLHTLGTSYPVKWVTVHDTAVDGTAPFDANALAKAAGATPFKRPENGQFMPNSGFRTFFFCITGDTDANAGNDPELAARGAWGGIFRVDFNALAQEAKFLLSS
jgi:hypothetical protein